ncbi:MAG: hypothetical protein C5B58_02080 [Acidobacteria bacterium]|nr:MAG: hypothetical protein C5B58_02080 [Acidobacteriota bacterium]
MRITTTISTAKITAQKTAAGINQLVPGRRTNKAIPAKDNRTVIPSKTSKETAWRSDRFIIRSDDSTEAIVAALRVNRFRWEKIGDDLGLTLADHYP